MAKACTFIGNRDLSLNEQWALRPRLQQAKVQIGRRTMIHRKKFERWIDQHTCIF